MKNSSDHEQTIDSVTTTHQKNQWVAPQLILLDSDDTFGKSSPNPSELNMNTGS